MALRELAGNIKIGAAVNNAALIKESQYQNVLATQFNLLVPENGMKCHVVCQNPNTYDFTGADAVVDFATKNDQFVRVHVLCWHHSWAKWMKNLTSLELEKVLRNYIFNIVERYKGKCYAWDVVSEAMDAMGQLRPSIWGSIENYMQKCFLWAHEADPDAHLIYLDYRLFSFDRWNAIAKMIASLKADGIPVHGVGLQLHYEVFRALGVSTLRLPELVRQLKQLGVVVHVSEVSVSIYPPAQNLPEAAKYQLQAQAYGQLMKGCLESGCESFTVWGFTDKYAYYPPPARDAKATPYLFDENYQPKPAYWAVERQLRQYLHGFSGEQRQALEGERGLEKVL